MLIAVVVTCWRTAGIRYVAHRMWIVVAGVGACTCRATVRQYPKAIKQSSRGKRLNRGRLLSGMPRIYA